MAMLGASSWSNAVRHTACTPSRRNTPGSTRATTRVVCEASSRCEALLLAATANSSAPSMLVSDRGRGSAHRRATRRGLLQLSGVTAAAAVTLTLTLGSGVATALPLAPLGRVGPTGGEKLSLTTEQLMEVLKDDLAVRQYFVTGLLTKEIFADDCRFQDPTNDIVGLARYVKALGILFDPSTSTVELQSIAVTGPRTVEANWTLGGTLLLPWHPSIRRFHGRTVYSLNDAGLIQTQEQQWSISAADALIQTFTPR